MHTAGSDPIFQIYMDAPPGVQGASEHQNFIFTSKSVEFLPFRLTKHEEWGF